MSGAAVEQPVQSRRAAADLLVMGAHGHSRLREMVLGGVTRSVLSDADIPVFLMH
jgi:nucleotide-binding universal stress UspA family protein